MPGSIKRKADANDGPKQPGRRSRRLALLLGLVIAPAIYVASVFYRYRLGDDGWFSAAGFPLSAGAVWIMGGIVALGVMSVRIRQNAYKLPPSREKIRLSRIGDLLLACVILWQLIYVTWLS